MNRRDFLKSCLAAGVGVGLSSLPIALSSAGGGGLFAAEAGGGLPDMVAVRNGEPEAMFDRGIAAMGGMGRFVKQGQKVAIKPNISWDSTPDYAGNTNPGLVSRIVQHCREAGASKVTVFDHCIEPWHRCYQSSGVETAARQAGALMAQGEAERYYHKVQLKGKVLREASVHEAMLDCDVLINVPILKHHGGAGMTAGLKNFMGAVWDRRFFHGRGLQQCIADFMLIRRPDLTIIDAYRTMHDNGPRTRSLGDVRLTKMQILTTDIVAGDVSAARILGRKPEDYAYIRMAYELGAGQIDPAKLNLRRLTL